MSDTKYTPTEILQILNDYYNCQVAFDPVVVGGEPLTFDVSISEWRDICDLIEPKSLARAYHESFKLKTPAVDLENILLKQENKLGVFCAYIAEHAIKQIVSPIILLGQSCMTASIFKTLINNLKEKGVKTQHIIPSSELIPLFDKYGGVMLEEVNKLAPGALTKFEYRENWIVRAGWSVTGIFLLSIIIIPLIWHFHWGLFITLALGILLIIIGNRFKVEKKSIGGYHTIKDLVLGMEAQINKAV